MCLQSDDIVRLSQSSFQIKHEVENLPALLWPAAQPQGPLEWMLLQLPVVRTIRVRKTTCCWTPQCFKVVVYFPFAFWSAFLLEWREGTNQSCTVLVGVCQAVQWFVVRPPCSDGEPMAKAPMFASCMFWIVHTSDALAEVICS